SCGRSARSRAHLPRAPSRFEAHPSTDGGFGYRGVAADWQGTAPRNSKETPTEVTPRRSRPDLPIIGLPALLSLVEWNEARRIKSPHGGSSCDERQANVSPPAPDRVEHTSTAEPALAGSDRRPAGANAPGAQPRRGSSTGRSFGRKGGLA